MTSNILIVDASALDRVSRNLRNYIAVSGKSEDEVLNKKGNDLRIQLFKGFFRQKWKRGAKGGGFRLLRQLTRANKGILVRLWSLRSAWVSQIPKVDKNGKDLTDYQKLVAQEVLRRQAGVGVLGASFLIQRWRYRKEARYLVTNNTRGFGKAVTFEKREHEFVVTGFTPGFAIVAQKYGIIGNALRKIAEDMDVYLERKRAPEFAKTIFA